MNKNTIINLIKEYVQIFIGIILASIGLKAFLLPNGFLDGGATGIAILVSEKINIDISIILVAKVLLILIVLTFISSKAFSCIL